MHCGILINTPLLSPSVLEILNDAYTTLSLINESHWSYIDWLSDTQSVVLQANCMIPAYNEKATLNINMPYLHFSIPNS